MRNELTIIHNSEELNRLIEESNELYEAASGDLKIDEIQYDSTSSSLFSGGALQLHIIFGHFYNYRWHFGNHLFYKANLLRAIIKRSTISDMDDGGNITLELPRISTPKNLMHRDSIDPINENIYAPGDIYCTRFKRSNWNPGRPHVWAIFLIVTKNILIRAAFHPTLMII